MQRYEAVTDEREDFGPGFDMAISMFAVALLLLTLTGAGFVHNAGGLSSADSPNAALSAAQQALLEEKEKNRALLVQTSKVKIELARANEDAKTARNEVDLIKQDNKRLAASNKSLGNNIIEYKKQQGSNPIIELPFQSITILAERDKIGLNFAKDSAELTPGGRDRLLTELKQHADTIAQLGTQVALLIEGHASPEPRKQDPRAPDTNMALAFDRAYSTGELLIRLGVPRRCLVIVSYGRSRSKMLSNWKKGWNEKDLENMFDTSWRESKNYVWQQKIEDAYAAERRIEIRATGDPNAICSDVELASALRQLP
jgi:outer membrane protein OmpA-like peptidoglycan-associated protein